MLSLHWFILTVSFGPIHSLDIISTTQYIPKAKCQEIVVSNPSNGQLSIVDLNICHFNEDTGLSEIKQCDMEEYPYTVWTSVYFDGFCSPGHFYSYELTPNVCLYIYVTLLFMNILYSFDNRLLPAIVHNVLMD